MYRSFCINLSVHFIGIKQSGAQLFGMHNKSNLDFHQQSVHYNFYEIVIDH